MILFIGSLWLPKFLDGDRCGNSGYVCREAGMLLIGKISKGAFFGAVNSLYLDVGEG
jgi:hypothetical protein